MSGIEIVGVVLAVVPLLISATEHYRDGSSFVARAIKKKILTERYRDALVQQQMLLKMHMKGVIGRTDLPQQTQAKIAESLASEVWKEPKITKAVIEELGDAYEPFVSILARVSNVLVKFVKLESKQDGEDAAVYYLQQLHSESLGVMDSESDRLSMWNRLKFSWKSSEWKSMIEELQTCNTTLERLILAADRAKPFVKKQKYHNVHIAFANREGGEKLFDILHNACTCEPSGLRQIGIRLQALIKSAAEIPSQSPIFRVLIVDAKDNPYEISAGVEMVPTYSTTAESEAASDTAERGRARVGMKLLEDICSETRAAYACKTHLQLFADHSDQIYCSPVKSTGVASVQPEQKYLSSLSDVLKACQEYDSKRWLHKEKSILAINLAYSLLQLHDGPWYSQWTSNNITFVSESKTNTSATDSMQTSLRQPYTRLPLLDKPPKLEPETTSKVPKRRLRRNVHLHALGIVLMELYLNCSIEEIATEEGTSDLRGLAQELLEDHADDISMSPEYLQAIRFCLSPRPNPHNGSFDFKDEGFREIYYSEVICMLEENLMQRFDATENSWLSEN